MCKSGPGAGADFTCNLHPFLCSCAVCSRNFRVGLFQVLNDVRSQGRPRFFDSLSTSHSYPQNGLSILPRASPGLLTISTV